MLEGHARHPAARVTAAAAEGAAEGAGGAAPREHPGPLPSPFVVDIQVRFRDTDRLGHVNNAVIATYAEVGRLTYLQAAGASVTSLILARLALDFRAQVHMSQRVQVATETARIGNTSITLRQTVLADGAVAADVESVLVCFDYAAQRPVPVPHDLRRTLQPAPH